MEKWLIPLIGYGFGCIQAAYLIGRLNNMDIRTVGSKNSGASNATMTFGWKIGASVALIDILKAVVAIFVIGALFNLSHADLQAKDIVETSSHIRFKGKKIPFSVFHAFSRRERNSIAGRCDGDDRLAYGYCRCFGDCSGNNCNGLYCFWHLCDVAGVFWIFHLFDHAVSTHWNRGGIDRIVRIPSSKEYRENYARGRKGTAVRYL